MKTLASCLSNKQKRLITRDINILNSQKGYLTPPTNENLGLLKTLSSRIKIKNKQLTLSNVGSDSLNRIIETIANSEKYNDLVEFGDVHTALLNSMEEIIEKNEAFNKTVLFEKMEHYLDDLIREFTYICAIDGLELHNIEELTIGENTIKLYDQGIIKKRKFTKKFPMKEKIDAYFNGKIVITGKETGSQSTSKNKFYFYSMFYISLIRLLYCAIRPASIYSVSTSLTNNSSISWSTTKTVGWNTLDRSGNITWHTPHMENTKIDEKIIHHFNSIFSLREISLMIKKDSKSEIEHAISRSILWYGEAQDDKSYSSKWIKLWTCMESFFSINNDKIVDRNTKSIACIILHGKYKFDGFNCNYKDLKRKITKYYRIRSKIIHRGARIEIQNKDLEYFAYITAWVIISFISYSLSGETSLKKVQEDLDELNIEI